MNNFVLVTGGWIWKRVSKLLTKTQTRWFTAAAHRTRFVRSILLGVMAMISAMSLQATTPEEKSVLMPVQKIMDGVAQRNHALVKDQLLPGGMATLIREGKPLQLHFDAFVERLPAIGVIKLEERLYDPLVRIDNDIAVVWVLYEYFIEGKIDHCGTDLFSLIRQDGRWLISGIADNSRKDCSSR